MKQYIITGMNCAACSARVEKAVSKLDGVKSCSVNLLTNSMIVEGNADNAQIIRAVEAAGYGAMPKNEASFEKDRKRDPFEDKKTPQLIKRLTASAIFLLVLMYFSMGHMMMNFPLPSWFNGNHVAVGLVQLLLTVIIMVINQRFFVSGYKGLLNKSPNMDTLVALGSSASFAWSVYALFAMTRAQSDGNMQAVMAYMDEFYFESAAMILTLITLGKTLEARSKGKTTDALKSLMKLAPQTAVIIRDSNEVKVPVEQVKKGDIFVVRPGESIPVDGIIVEGSSAVNEAVLTGESIPSDKTVGDSVSAATINQSGFIRCEASRVGEDTTLSQIIKSVSDASATKAPIAKVADKVSGVFVPVVIAVAIITLIVWLSIGKEFSFALARAISVLVISCPCALGLATPVAIMVGNGLGAKNGILFKNAQTLENAGKVKIAALDKTGTITEGMPKVTDIIPSKGITIRQLMQYAASLEAKSEHPLAKAVIQKGSDLNIAIENVTDFSALPGNGLTAKFSERELIGGSLEFIGKKTSISSEMQRNAEKLSEEGKTPLLFMYDGELLGIIAVADTIKADSRRAIEELHDMGIHVVMLTGDNERTAKAIGKQAGVDEVIAGVMPDGKESVIRSFMKRGKTVMVGDGINDAPALTVADVGIAIGAGTDVAIDAADVVLMKSRLSDVPAAIRLSRATLRNIHENLFWAFIYNIIGIPLAAGCFVSLGLTLNPMFGAAAMSLSSVCVVTNALRLNLFKINLSKTNRDSKNNGENNQRIIKVKGMMCGHCEERVKKSLELLDGVHTAVADHKSGKVDVVLNGQIDNDRLKAAVEGQGYKVISIK